MDSADATTTIPIGWWSRQSLFAGARACYRLLLDIDQRLVFCNFAADEPFYFIFARGERALELRELVETGVVEPVDFATPQRTWEPDEVSKDVVRDITAAARRAGKMMQKHGRRVFLVEFAEEAEPILMVFALGVHATDLRAAGLACGLISPEPASV